MAWALPNAVKKVELSHRKIQWYCGNSVREIVAENICHTVTGISIYFCKVAAASSLMQRC